MRDGQPQTGSFELPVPFIFDLIKFTKDVFDLVGWDSDAGVFDCNGYLRAAGIEIWHAGDTHRYVAFVGELDGIAHQVGQNLAHAASIANIRRGHEQIEV